MTAQNSGPDSLMRQDAAFGREAVGRLDSGDGGSCIGTLIATDLVLTARHGLFDRQTGAPQDTGRIRVRAGLRDGGAVAERDPRIRRIGQTDGSRDVGARFVTA